MSIIKKGSFGDTPATYGVTAPSLNFKGHISIMDDRILHTGLSFKQHGKKAEKKGDGRLFMEERPAPLFFPDRPGLSTESRDIARIKATFGFREAGRGLRGFSG